jgi:hypothetical protein
MIKVKLYTSDGRFVSEALMPPFRELPDVVVWGARVFGLQAVPATSGGELIASDDPVYQEVFCCAVWSREQLAHIAGAAPDETDPTPST